MTIYSLHRGYSSVEGNSSACSKVSEEALHLLAHSAILLFVAPLYSPFPVTLTLSAVATCAFIVELVIARLRVHPSIGMYVLLASCIALGVILMAWSGYFALNGPATVARMMPRFHLGVRLPDIRNPWYDFYTAMWYVNFAIAFLTLILPVSIAISLRKYKERSSSGHLN